MNIKPIGNRILVKPEVVEQKTMSGIVLPETMEKQQKEQGVIVAMGEGEGLKKLQLKIGDKVIFGKYSGEEVSFDKVEYKFIKHEDILGKVE
jgi:chaperonin GroES